MRTFVLLMTIGLCLVGAGVALTPAAVAGCDAIEPGCVREFLDGQECVNEPIRDREICWAP